MIAFSAQENYLTLFAYHLKKKKVIIINIYVIYNSLPKD